VKSTLASVIQSRSVMEMSICIVLQSYNAERWNLNSSTITKEQIFHCIRSMQSSRLRSCSVSEFYVGNHDNACSVSTREEFKQGRDAEGVIR
jgi:hypothetical protein